MKYTLYLLFTLVLLSCKADYDSEKLKYAIHNHCIVTDDFGCCYRMNDIDYKSIVIDSVVPYAKHLFLKEQLDLTKQLIDITYSEKDDPYKTFKLKIHYNERDSLNNVLIETKKEDNIYKCYFKLPEDIINELIYLDENYKPIECGYIPIEEE